MGPLLLARMLDLNETQEGVLTLVFKIADDNGLLLLDLKDLRAMLQYVGDNAAQFTTAVRQRRRRPAIGAIQRGLLQIEEQGGDRFFGEPMLDIDDLHADRCRRPRRGQHPRRRQADEHAAAVRDASCCGCCPSCSRRCPRSATSTSRSWCSSSTRRTCCSTTRRRRWSSKIEQVVRLIRSQGRRRLLRHAEPARHSRHRARPARQPRAARAARLHAARPEGGARRPPRRCAPTRSSTSRRRSPSSPSARRWSALLDEKGRPASPSARSCCRRRARSARSRPTSASR